MHHKRDEGAGKFVWHELVTGDIDGAIEYYGKLFGWEFKDVYRGELGMCKVFGVHGSDIGGMLPLEADGDITAHWMPYVTVGDVPAGAANAGQLDGRAVSPPRIIPGFGQVAVVQDPGGARVSLISADEPPGDRYDGPPRPGTFIWNELLSRDPEGAGRFYCGVFGWQLYSMDMGEEGKYFILRRDDENEAGIILKPDQAEGGSAWLPYVAVTDIDASCVMAAHGGGSIFIPPTDLHGAGRYAVTGDPAGALFALFQPASAAAEGNSAEG